MTSQNIGDFGKTYRVLFQVQCFILSQIISLKVSCCSPSESLCRIQTISSMFPFYEASLSYGPKSNETSEIFGLFLAWWIYYRRCTKGINGKKCK